MNGVIAEMVSESKSYNAQYDLNKKLRINVFNGKGILPEKECRSFHEIMISDNMESRFYYSPFFQYDGGKIAFEAQSNYSTDFYLFTNKIEYAKRLNYQTKFKIIRIYNGLLNQLYYNPVISATSENDFLKLSIRIKSQTSVGKEIVIGSYNIEKIRFSGDCISEHNIENWQEEMRIKYANYIDIILTDSIAIGEIKPLLNRIQYYLNLYCMKRISASRVIACTETEECYEVKCNQIKEEADCNCLYFPIKMDFFDYFEKALKEFDYDGLKHSNQLISFANDDKKTLEDQFLFYYKYIDIFMGSKSRGKDEATHIQSFIDEYNYLFEKGLLTDNLNYKITSLRHHYAHEGYYFKNDEYEIKKGPRNVIGIAKIDYGWLSRIVHTFMVGCMIILLKEKMMFNINEDALLNACLRQI